MKKTTQRDIKELVTTGIACDITHISPTQADALQKAHRLTTIAVSYDKFGKNGALFRDEDGRLYAVTARNGTFI